MPDIASSLKDRLPHQPPEKVLSFSSFYRWEKRGIERLSITPNIAQLTEPGHLTPEPMSDPVEPVLLLALAHPLILANANTVKQERGENE